MVKNLKTTKSMDLVKNCNRRIKNLTDPLLLESSRLESDD